eukprot:TRINITY_DN104617_c0_g1_i1.p1 TRINITY_DN104617_c0_g1~~TRINITY_DN104617_c0_g1_i1.p1  ORF type:complete len:324 (-),score=64.76 TRINITY_DN104617_c0_g1_i1:64-1002(-)
MEFSLLNKGDLTDHHILSVRAEDVKKQTPIGRGKSLKFPQASLVGQTLKVEVFQPVGTAYLVPLPGRETYMVHFDSGLACEVALCAQGGFQPPQDAEVQQLQESQLAAAKAAKSYLEKHQVQQVVQSVLKTVIDEKPEDPFSHMMRHLSRGYGHEKPPEISRKEPSQKTELGQARATGKDACGLQPRLPARAAPLEGETPAASASSQQNLGRDSSSAPSAPKRDRSDVRKRASLALLKGAADGRLQQSIARNDQRQSLSSAPAEKLPQEIQERKMQVAYALGRAAQDGRLQEELASVGTPVTDQVPVAAAPS